MLHCRTTTTVLIYLFIFSSLIGEKEKNGRGQGSSNNRNTNILRRLHLHTLKQTNWKEADSKFAIDIGLQPYLSVSQAKHKEGPEVPTPEGEPNQHCPNFSSTPSCPSAMSYAGRPLVYATPNSVGKTIPSSGAGDSACEGRAQAIVACSSVYTLQ